MQGQRPCNEMGAEKKLKKYLPAKRAMLTLYIIMALIGLFMNVLIYRYITMLPPELLSIISQAAWILILAVSMIIIPHYFLRAKVVITQTEVAAAAGYFSYRTDYMPINAIKSVSVIITPLGSLTGLNFVVINALGARVLISCLRKNDAVEIAETINKRLREMEVHRDA